MKGKPSYLLQSRQRNRGRRQGQVIVYTALGMVALMMVGAYTLDIGYLYTKRNQVQATADASALAGAYKLANFQSRAIAIQYARWCAWMPINGGYATPDNAVSEDGVTAKYANTTTGTKVSVTYPAKDEDGKVRSNWFRIDISRPEDTFFAGAMDFGNKKSSWNEINVGAYAIAQYETLAPMNINGNGNYGADPKEVNLSLFGPNGLYSHGDCYSTMYLDDKKTKNPLYDGKGYDFQLLVPQSMGNTTVELYDPDCYNKNNQYYTSVDSSGNPVTIDELRNSAGNAASSSSDITSTTYTLYDDNGTPNNPNDDVYIDSKTYGNTSTTDMKWNNAFSFNRSSYGNRNFRINVTTISGASENGFSMRAGPTRTGNQTFNANNGTSISATGHLPINFNKVATAKIALGNVPIEAAGGKLNIRKFDTDVGAVSINYTTSSPSLNTKTWNGDLTANGQFGIDTIDVPDTYTKEGTWYANYKAGANDTTVWSMSYSNAGPGQPGYIKLVR